METFGSTTGGGKIHYAQIVDGKVHIKSTKENPEAIERVNKKGNTVYDIVHGYVQGVIKDIEIIDNPEFGNQLIVSLENNDDSVKFQMAFQSRYAYGFMMALPNIDFTKVVRFSPWSKTTVDNGVEKKKMALYLSYSPFGKENQIDWYYTGDKAKELPEIIKTTKKVMGKDKVEFDNSDRQNFLYDMLQNEILPKLQKRDAVEKASSDLPF